MRTFQHEVAGDPVTINTVETVEDLDGFRQFIVANRAGTLGLDTETTGLDIYSDRFKLRLVQFGTASEAWVLPVELGGPFAEAAAEAIAEADKLVLQHATYDLQVLDRTLSIEMETVWPKVVDTKILAHLVDPRAVKEGGKGHSLQELTAGYIDADIAANVKGLMKTLASDTKGASHATIWSKVDLFHPGYQLYAGMDTILVSRLLHELDRRVPAESRKLIKYEHRLAEVCAYIERTGFLLDVEYSEKLADELRLEESINCETALKFGCESVNSTDQVADVLEARGVTIPNRTPSGKRQVNDELLSRLAEQGDEFAAAVVTAKKAGKWRKTWVQKFLDQRDSKDRCHASINPLQCRTARMSITGIPAQTLPAGNASIRNCFVADPHQRIVSVDYQAQELRVLAALSKDQTMIRAFAENADLHLMTAQAAFGPGVTKDSVERKYAKTVNFGRVYGGGAKTVAEQTGLDLVTAKRVVDGFDKTYPGVQVLSRKLQAEALKKGVIFTPTGRMIPVDQQKAYSALNYLIQSTSRDVTGRALIRLHDAGFTPYMRLPIHDEVLFSIPEQHVKFAAGKIAGLMADHMDRVDITTDATIGGRSWGSLYEKELA
jgi:DNA polymerase-1